MATKVSYLLKFELHVHDGEDAILEHFLARKTTRWEKVLRTVAKVCLGKHHRDVRDWRFTLQHDGTDVSRREDRLNEVLPPAEFYPGTKPEDGHIYTVVAVPFVSHATATTLHGRSDGRCWYFEGGGARCPESCGLRRRRLFWCRSHAKKKLTVAKRAQQVKRLRMFLLARRGGAARRGFNFGDLKN